jgi:hypothetical protein
MLKNESTDAINNAVQALKTLTPGYLPLPLFLEVSRLSVSAIIELVALRRTPEGNLETLLFRREADDHYWPNMWANPGTVIRPTDAKEGLGHIFKRLYDEDFSHNYDEVPTFASTILYSSERGTHFAAIYWIEIQSAPGGTFFPVDNLPADIVQAQVGVIQQAALHYRTIR